MSFILTSFRIKIESWIHWWSTI